MVQLYQFCCMLYITLKEKVILEQKTEKDVKSVRIMAPKFSDYSTRLRGGYSPLNGKMDLLLSGLEH